MEENKTSFSSLFNAILSSSINHSHSWEDICSSICKHTTHVLNIEDILIGRFDEQQNFKLVASHKSKNFIYAQQITENFQEFLAHNARNLSLFGTGKNQITPNCHAVKSKHGNLHILTLPISTVDSTIEGVLEVWLTYEIDASVLSFFERLANFIGLAAQIKRYQHKISRQSDIISALETPLVVSSQNGEIKWVNTAFINLCQMDEQQIYKNSLFNFLQDEKQKKELQKILKDTKKNKADFSLSIANHEDISVCIGITPLNVLENEENYNLILTIENISSRLADSQRIAYLTSFDHLTGLPNRVAFLNNLQSIIFDAGISNKPLAVIFIKLINFEHIKNTLGSEASNLMLKSLAERVSYMAGEKTHCAQLGPEEFGLIVDIPKVIEQIDFVAKKIINKMSEPENIFGKDMFLRTSLGITFFPRIKDSEQLLTCAEIAGKIAASEKPGSHYVYNDKMGNDTKNKIEIEKDLQRAIENDEFLIVYQPQINIETNEPIGAEALIRWKHPEKGMISPASFIPVAEDSGLILRLGDVQINKILQQCKIWQDKGLNKLKIGINLSALQFNQDDLVESIKNKIKKYEVNSETLDFEITESTLMTDFERANKILRELSRLNVNISIDDFGTGYSSLNYLKRFPINTIKIDQSFIREIDRNNEDVEIVNFISNLGHLLKLNVVAEGIETQEHLEIVSQKGVNIAQGFYVSKPLSANDFENFLHTYKE